MKPQPVLVLGCTAYTSVFVDMFEAVKGYEFTGCVENISREKCSDRISDLPIYWHENISELRASHRLICALATTHRMGWVKKMKEWDFEFCSLFHPSSVISEKTEIGSGVSIDASCVIAGYSRIYPHVRIGRQISFGHHIEIGAYSTLHPGCVVSGNCTIGEQVTIGTGAVVIDGISIGSGAVVAAGAVVTKDVPENALVAGNPATVKRKNYGPS